MKENSLRFTDLANQLRSTKQRRENFTDGISFLEKLFFFFMMCGVLERIIPLALNRIYMNLFENRGTLCKNNISDYKRNIMFLIKLIYVHVYLEQGFKSHLA